MLTKRKYQALLTMAWLSINAHITYADISPLNTPSSFFNKTQYNPIATITIGPDFVHPGQSQNLTLLPPFQNHYTASRTSQTVADIGAFIGIEHAFTDKLSMQLGASIYTNTSFSVKGHVWQFALPLFDDLTYAYHIHHTRVMATSKLLMTPFHFPRIHPYLSGEIGDGFNQAKNYQEKPIVPDAVPTAPFANHKQSYFVWGAGFGVDYDFTQLIRLGAGYQFSSLGSASLGPTVAALTNQTLHLPRIDDNQIRFQLTIFI